MNDVCFNQQDFKKYSLFYVYNKQFAKWIKNDLFYKLFQENLLNSTMNSFKSFFDECPQAKENFQTL